MLESCPAGKVEMLVDVLGNTSPCGQVEQTPGCLVVRAFDWVFFNFFLACLFVMRPTFLLVSCVAGTSLPTAYQTGDQHLLASGNKEDGVL